MFVDIYIIQHNGEENPKENLCSLCGKAFFAIMAPFG